MHLRRGDYGFGKFYRAPCQWFENWLEQSGIKPDDFVIYLCSDEPQAYRDRFTAKGFSVFCHLDFEFMAELKPFLDFYIITVADQCAVSESTYSIFACMLNDNAKAFYKSDIAAKGLTSFDPWNCKVFESDSALSPEEHQILVKLD